MKLSAVFFIFAAGNGSLMAKPLQYRLVIASKTGQVSELTSDLLSRKLPGIEYIVMKQGARYKRAPHFPMPVCDNAEYYLLGPGEDLLQIGCIRAAGSVAHIAEIRQAMELYKDETRRGQSPTLVSQRRIAQRNR